MFLLRVADIFIRGILCQFVSNLINLLVLGESSAGLSRLKNIQLDIG